MKNLTVKKLEKKFAKEGLLICKATDHIESLQHAENWHQGSVPKRCYGIVIDYLDGSFCPKISFTSLAEINDYMMHI